MTGSWARTRRAAAIGATVVREVGRQRDRPLPERVVGALTALGPTFVKIGQVLSTRRDLVPGPWHRALAALADEVPPPPAAVLENALRAAYGAPDAWPFRSIELTPVASGSIATVHAAELADGRAVAVKLRRPGIVPIMRTDLALLATVAGWAARVPRLSRVPIRQMVEEVGAAIAGQLDFEAERAALYRLRANFADDPAIRIPAPADELCTPTTIVMEFIEDLRRVRPAELSLPARAAAARHILTTVYRMLFLDGLVHCDLHGGNVYFRPDGSLVIVDAGFAVDMDDRTRRLFADFFAGMALGRGWRCADVVIESARRIDKDCDLEGFRHALAEWADAASGAVAGEFNLAVFAAGLFDLQRRYGLYAAPEFVFPLVALLVVEGFVLELDAEVDFQSLALPVMLRRYETTVAGRPD